MQINDTAMAGVGQVKKNELLLGNAAYKVLQTAQERVKVRGFRLAKIDAGSFLKVGAPHSFSISFSVVIPTSMLKDSSA